MHPFFFWKDVICISSYAAHTYINDTVPHSYLVLKTEILKVGNLRPNMTLICWKLLYSEKNKHVRLKFVEK